jgi:hypothetical protein
MQPKEWNQVNATKWMQQSEYNQVNITVWMKLSLAKRIREGRAAQAWAKLKPIVSSLTGSAQLN